MKTQEMTEIKALVLLPELKSPNSKYIPRHPLLIGGSVKMEGRWTAEEVLSFCERQAKAQGFAPCELDIEYSYVDGEGDYFTAQIEGKEEA